MNLTQLPILSLLVVACSLSFATISAIKPTQAVTCKALLDATMQGDYKKAANLVKRNNPGVDEPNTNGVTPLMVATYKGSLELTLLFLRAGANLHAITLSNKDFTFSTSLTNKNKGTTALMLACAMGHLEVVKALLQKEPSLNAQDSLGQTALHYAILGDPLWPDAPLNETRKALILLLLEEGANPNLVDDHGLDAIYYYKTVAGLTKEYGSYDFKEQTLQQDPLYKRLESRV